MRNILLIILFATGLLLTSWGRVHNLLARKEEKKLFWSHKTIYKEVIVGKIKSPKLIEDLYRDRDRIRTCDRLLRRQMLYPAELRDHYKIGCKLKTFWLLINKTK